MQGNKVRMLTNKMFGNVDIVDYSNIVLLRCVDNNNSMSCYIHTLVNGVFSWQKLQINNHSITNDLNKYVAC